MAEFVEQVEAESSVGDRGADFFKFVEVEEEATAWGEEGEGVVEPVFEGGVGVGFEGGAIGDGGEVEVLGAGVAVDGADKSVAEVGFAAAEGAGLEVEVDGDEVAGE